jgi:hypothetical protein
VARILTPERAAQAVYFDFEGCVGEAPSLLGWSVAGDDDLEHFEQRILEPGLCTAARTVPHTGGTVRCSGSTLHDGVLALVALAEHEDRPIVSWAHHDMTMIERYVDDSELVARAAPIYMNALPTVRQWLKRTHPDMRLERTWGGRHTLSRYCEIMGISVPTKYGRDVASKGIRTMRGAIERYGSYSAIPPEAGRAREAWKALLGHNRLDCRVTRMVVMRAALEYVEAGSH